MKLKEDSSYNKLHGIYYTPRKMASEMIRLFVGAGDVKNVLEPSCGNGVFVEQLHKKYGEKLNIEAVEIEKKETEILQKKYSTNNIKIINKDFFEYYSENEDRKFNLIIGNPPYIRYQYLTSEQRSELSHILLEHDMKPNKLINAWVAFTIACASMIADEGALAFVIPAELLQVVYAKDLRKYLTAEFNEINIVAFNELTFEEIEQEVVLLICRKTKAYKGMRIIQVANVDDLKHVKLSEYPFHTFEDNADKWTKYFNSSDDVEILNSIKADGRFQKLSDVALINVGITTGNNNYFSIDKETNSKYHLEDFCMPLLGKSCQVKSALFEKRDLLANYEKGKRSYLLVIDAQDRKYLPKNLVDYIELGESTGANLGYKCSIRDYWYSVPSVWVPDAFFSRRNNLYPKLLLNKCSAVSTDTMHRMKFLNNTSPERIALSYYNSVSFAFTEVCGRSYGGGVLEILPSEAGNVFVPIIDEMDIENVKAHLKKVDELIRKNDDIEIVLDYVDKIVLQEHHGMSESECRKYRNVWLNLRARRLGRSKN